MSIILITLLSCRKDKVENADYRDPYNGEYNFKIVVHSWMLGSPDEYDTLFRLGHIKKYEYFDSQNGNVSPVYIDSTAIANYERKITINYSGHSHMISNLNEDGTLEPLSGYHYGHSGHLLGMIQFIYLLAVSEVSVEVGITKFGERND